MKSLLYLLSLVLLSWSCQNQPPPPNIVYILADDLGTGDLSCLNPSGKINTPNLDKLAAQGRIFTDAHSNSAVCTPTRYGILTGRYAWRTSLQSGVTWSYDQPLIDQNRLTVASYLKKHGYHTAGIGKWHLGLGWVKDTNGNVDFLQPLTEGPNDNGFDYFYGITASLDIPPYFYLENDRITATTIDTVKGNDMQGKAFWRPGPIGDDFDFWEVLPNLTQKAVSYITDRSKTQQPFFLYFPLPAPHTPILPTEEYIGKSGTNAYGDFVVMVDDMVGQVMQALEANEATSNTLFIFTSDNGCSPRADFPELAAVGHDPSYVYRGHKADIFEGGHRVPFIARWPGHIPAGTTSGALVSLTDLLATCAAIIGDTIPETAGEDSYSMLTHLTDRTDDHPIRPNMIQHSINGSFAFRQGDWKLAVCPGSGGWSFPRPDTAQKMGLPDFQLFNLKDDIAEAKNVFQDQTDRIETMLDMLTTQIEDGRSTAGNSSGNDVAIQVMQ